MDNSSISFEFIRAKDTELLYSLGQMILGYTKEELGNEFLEEADKFICNLDDFLIGDLRLLLNLFNSRLVSFLLTGSFKKFEDKDIHAQEQYYRKWSQSKLGLLRTGASTLRALCGWSFYSLEKSWNELDIPGKTIGREDITPTLLEGKMTWEVYKEERIE